MNSINNIKNTKFTYAKTKDENYNCQSNVHDEFLMITVQFKNLNGMS